MFSTIRKSLTSHIESLPSKETLEKRDKLARWIKSELDKRTGMSWGFIFPASKQTEDFSKYDVLIPNFKGHRVAGFTLLVGNIHAGDSEMSPSADLLLKGCVNPLLEGVELHKHFDISLLNHTLRKL